MPLNEVLRMPYLFPFDLVSLGNDVRRTARFEVSRQGLDLEMVALAQRQWLYWLRPVHEAVP